MIIKKNSKKKQFLTILIKYFIVGLSGIIVDNSVILILSIVFNMKPQIATLISAEAGNISNFFINDNWTFRKIKEGNWYIRILKYHLSVIVGYIIAKILLFESVYKFTLLIITNRIYAIIIANTIVIFIGAIVNFSINIIWTWRFKGDKDLMINSVEDFEN